ncbi:MAG TPA: hypothetical protein VNP36_16255 [Burkholderiales bacterium]|nr:hypothetical protein [Burkholderiales bacterium]
MKRKNLMLTVAAAAALGAFNPAFAGGGAKHGSADDVSSPPTAVQGQPGTQSGPAIESAETNPDAGLSADANAGTGTTTEKSPSAGSQFGNSDMTLGGIGPQASAERGQDVDPQTGLDRGHPAN